MYDEIIYVCDECDSEYELVIRESNEDAKFCPFCGKENIICLNTWGISSTEEDNEGEATEYQCRADCGGRSFWT